MHCNTVRSYLSLLLVALAVVEIPVGLKAQPLLNVDPGSRVRLKIDKNSSWLVGVYQGRRADSLHIVLSGESQPKLFKLAHISEAEVSRGQFRHVRKGALTGAAIGAGVGFLGVLISSSDNYFETAGEYLRIVAIFTGVGAATGALSGVVVGIVSGESWTPVSLKGFAGGDTAISFRVGYRFRF